MSPKPRTPRDDAFDSQTTVQHWAFQNLPNSAPYAAFSPLNREDFGPPFLNGGPQSGTIGRCRRPACISKIHGRPVSLYRLHERGPYRNDDSKTTPHFRDAALWQAMLWAGRRGCT